MKTIVIGLAAAIAIYAQPTVTTTNNASALANALIGSGITLVGTPTYSGAATQSGTFSGGPASTIGFSNGIVLTTGLAASAAGRYAGADLPSTSAGAPGDSGLTALVNSPTYDAAVLQFQFTSTSPTVYFKYTFASAEYPNYETSNYNDVFAFFVNGTNYATIPGTTVPVSVNNLNSTRNSSFFGGYNTTGSPSPYGAQTRVLSFSAPVSTTGVNTIRLAIADTSDDVLDSAVFIQAGSLSTTSNLTITGPCPAPSGTPGVAYPGFTISAAGGTPPYTYTQNLPAWLTFNPTTMAVTATGTPPAAGTFPISITVTDSGSFAAPQRATYSCSIAVNSQAPLMIVGSCPVPDAMQGASYSGFPVYVSGGTPPYSYTPVLPAGLVFNAVAVTAPGTNTVSGAPTVTGAGLPITVRVSDSSTQRQAGTYSCTINIARQVTPTLTITGPCTGGSINSFYSNTLSVAGGTGPYQFALTGPSWLTLTANPFFASGPAGVGVTAIISGAPPQPGSFPVTVKVTDAVGATATYNCTILIGVPQLSISPKVCPAVTAPQGSPFTLNFGASGGTGDISFSVITGSLPPGLLFNSNGTVSGTPTIPGTYLFSISVSSGVQFDQTSQCSITVTAPKLQITSGCPGNGTVNGAYGPFTLSATGTGYSIGATGLPDGVSLNGNMIAGTPTKAGNFNVAIQATRGTESASQSCAVTIAPQALQVSASCPSDTQAGGSVSGALSASGGQKPYKYSISGPGWLTVDPNTGAITGVAPQDAAGTSVSFGGSVSDASTPSQSATAQGCTFKVLAPVTQPPTLAGTCPATNRIQGTQYSLALSVTDGQAPFSWTYDGGDPNLSLASSTGATNSLSGSLDQLGQFTFTVGITDALKRTATKSCSVNVTAALTITPSAACPSGSLDFASTFTRSFTVAGGSAPYTWTVTPANLFTLSAATGASTSVSGTLTQTGTIPFAVTVTDSSGNTQTYSCPLNVQFTPPSATPVLGTVPTDLTQPVPLTLVLSAPLTIPITGTVTVTFTSKATHPSPNPPGPATLTAGNPYNFTIPAGSTTFTLPAVQRGLESGTIHVAITGLSAAGQTVPPPPVIDFDVPRQAPLVTADNVQLNSTSGGFNILISGSSSTRDITGGSITFNAATGATVQGSSVDLGSLGIAALFDTFYTNPAHPLTSFTNLTIPVTIQGDTTAITSVTVTLTNSAGSTTVTKSR